MGRAGPLSRTVEVLHRGYPEVPNCFLTEISSFPEMVRANPSDQVDDGKLIAQLFPSLSPMASVSAKKTPCNSKPQQHKDKSPLGSYLGKPPHCVEECDR